MRGSRTDFASKTVTNVDALAGICVTVPQSFIVAHSTIHPEKSTGCLETRVCCQPLQGSEKNSPKFSANYDEETPRIVLCQAVMQQAIWCQRLENAGGASCPTTGRVARPPIDLQGKGSGNAHVDFGNADERSAQTDSRGADTDGPGTIDGASDRKGDVS